MDAYHKAQLTRLLVEILDSPILAQSLCFKGGTCAAMLGYLDRFSVDLDFDVKPGSNEAKMRREFHTLFPKLGLTVQDESKKALEFFLKYKAPVNQRNTIKLDVLNQVFKANVYRPQFLTEIDRVANCQTIETMFANKLVAPVDRWERNGTIAGRDIYDIHHFYEHGYKYLPEVIGERTGLPVAKYLHKLAKFVEKQVSAIVIDQDLNTLLPAEKFRQIRKTLKNETLMFLKSDAGN